MVTFTNQKTLRQRLMVQTCAVAMVMSLAMHAAQAEDKTYKFDIPPMSLEQALEVLGDQAGISVIYRDNIRSDDKVPALNGDLGLEEALQELLSGSGYTFRKLSDSSIAIVPVAESGQNQQSNRLDTLLVTATRSEKPVSAIPGAVTVIEGDDIRREMAFGGDAAALVGKYIPGYGLSNESISGASENFRGRSVLVMVDGVVRSTPLRNASRVISTVGLHNIERIEVVSGSSSMYGAGASGGMINLITKKAAKDALDITLSTHVKAFTENIADSFAPEATLEVSGTQEKFDYLVNLRGRMSGDAYDGDGNLQPSDPFLGQGGIDNTENLEFSAKVGTDIGDQRFEMSHNSVWMNQEPEFNADYATDPVSADRNSVYQGDSVLEQSHYTVGEYSKAETGFGSLDLQLYYNDIEKRFAFVPQSAANTTVYFANGQISPDGQTTLFAEQFGLRATVVSSLDQLVEGAELTWGSDISYDKTSQTFNDGVAAIAPMEQLAFSVFAQASLPVAEYGNLSGGLRYERFHLDIQDFLRPQYHILGLGASTARFVHGDKKTYDAIVWNLGAVAFVTEESEFYGGYSQGYTIPDIGAFTRRAGAGSVAELLSTADVFLDDVVPEAQIVNTFEIGFRGDWGDARLDSTAYVSTSDEGVTIDANSLKLSQQKERIWGAEITAEVAVTDDVKAGTVLSYTEGVFDSDQNGDLDFHLPNNRIPSPYRATVYGDFPLLMDARMRLEAVGSSGRGVFDGTSTVKIAPSLVFNMSASMPLQGGNLDFGISNILDHQYENSTASAVRNRPVAGMGRTIGLGYTVTF